MPISNAEYVHDQNRIDYGKHRPQQGEPHVPVDPEEVQNGTVWQSWLSTYMVQWAGVSAGQSCWILMGYSDGTSGLGGSCFIPVAADETGRDHHTKEQIVAVLNDRLCRRVPVRMSPELWEV